MTDMVRTDTVRVGGAPSLPPARPTWRRSRLDLGTIIVFAPIPFGLVVGLLSLMIGADVGYVILQLLLFSLVTPLLYIIRTDEKYTAAMLLAGFAKIFLISQVIVVLTWHAPDIGLANPTATEIGIATGIASGIVGILFARVLFSALPVRQPLLSWDPNPANLRRLGEITAVIGLISQIIWTRHVSGLTADQHGGVGIQSTGVPIFAVLAPLSIVSMCCFAAETIIRSDRKALFSTRLLIVLAIYFPAVLPLTSKTEPLRPLVALFVVALVYRWRPKPLPILAGLALFVVVMQFFYPAVTMARMTAFGEQRPLPEVFAEITIKSITDPAEFDYIRDHSDMMEAGIRQTYYGKVMGFWDRFTPQTTDRLISGSQYFKPVGPAVFLDALKQILPQSLGFVKDGNRAQERIEIALNGARQGGGKVGWVNSGYVGDAYVSGGLVMVVANCFLLGFLSSLVSRLVFNYKINDVLWIPFFSIQMFLFADSGFSTSAYTHFWTWVVYVGSIFAILQYMARRKSPQAAG